jgi:hypothetical protein
MPHHSYCLTFQLMLFTLSIMGAMAEAGFCLHEVIVTKNMNFLIPTLHGFVLIIFLCYQ